jgi:hypothetical protein
VGFHLATEPPSSRGIEGWAHAVVDDADAEFTVCGLPAGELTNWPTVVFPDDANDVPYCPACSAHVERSYRA